MDKFERLARYYCFFSIIALFSTLFLPAMQEEFEYPMRAMAMYLSGDYLNTISFGHFYARPPLMSWLILSITHIVGWPHILVASRLVTATSTALTAWILFKLTQALTGKKNNAYLSVAVYFSFALTIKLGWLAYADTLMSLGVMISIYGLWLGVERRQNRYLILGACGVIIGFMAKALVPYGIYAILGVSLLCFHQNRWFLLKPWSIVIGLATIAYIFVWARMANPHYLQIMWFTLVHGENHYDLLKSFATIPSYLYQVFWTQPTEFLLAIFPLGIIALYQFFKENLTTQLRRYYPNSSIAFFTFLIVFIPCWFSWRQWPETRYYLPVIPLFALFASYLLQDLSHKQKKLCIILLWIMIAVKIISVIGFYIFYNRYRIDYTAISADVVKISKKHPIYLLDTPACSADGLMYYGLDRALMPHKMIPYNNGDKDKAKHYLVCYTKKSQTPTLGNGETLVKTYGKSYQRERVYLIKVNTRPH